MSAESKSAESPDLTAELSPTTPGEELINLCFSQDWTEERIGKIKDLVNRGADPDFKNDCGQTPLMMLITSEAPLDLIDLLLEQEVDVNAADNLDFNTVLHCAAEL